jgi:hypothetical protein
MTGDIDFDETGRAHFTAVIYGSHEVVEAEQVHAERNRRYGFDLRFERVSAISSSGYVMISARVG